MRDFASLESLARTWRVDEQQIREAASRAGVMLFTWHGRAHVETDDLKQLGEALNRKDAAPVPR